MKDRTNKLLLAVFVLSVAVCAVCWITAIHLLLFVLVVPFFCLQLLLLRLTRERLLRLIPAGIISLMLVLAGGCYFFGTGWDTLAGLILAFASIAPTVGCIAAGLVYRFSGTFPGRK